MAVAEQQPCAEILWKIENFSYCWQEKKDCLTSSKFFFEGLGKTSWHLSLFPKGVNSSDNLGLFLYRENHDEGDDTVCVKFEMAVLANGNIPFVTKVNEDRSFQQGGNWGFSSLVSRSDIVNSAEKLCPMNVLTVRCKMWPVNAQQPYSPTVVHLQTLIPITQCSFKWSIDLAKVETSDQEKTITFRSLFGSKDFLQVKLSYLLQNIDSTVLKIFISGNALNEYSYKCDIQTVQAKEDFFLTVRKINDLPYDVICSTLFTLSQLVENSEKYLVGIILPLSCEFSIISHKVRNYNSQSIIKSEQSSVWIPRMIGNNESVHHGKSPSTSNHEVNFSLLKTDILKMYQEGLKSDFDLLVEAKTFPVHSNILSARSAVLQRMLDTEMREKQEKILKIEDLDGNTVKKMLDYVYTDSPGKLDMESAVKLYYAGDKYELFGLKKMCSDYMMQNIAICNLYEVLMVAYRHNDEDIKSSGLQFISKNEKEVVLSEQFKTFTKNNLEFGMEIVQRLLESKLEK